MRSEQACTVVCSTAATIRYLLGNSSHLEGDSRIRASGESRGPRLSKRSSPEQCSTEPLNRCVEVVSSPLRGFEVAVEMRPGGLCDALPLFFARQILLA